MSLVGNTRPDVIKFAMTQLVDAGSSEQIYFISFSSLFVRETGAQRTVGTDKGKRGEEHWRKIESIRRNIVLSIREPARVCVPGKREAISAGAFLTVDSKGLVGLFYARPG